MVEGIHEDEALSPRQREIEAELRRYLIDELLEEFYDRPYEGDDPLADGEVDSLGIEQLLEQIDARFGVSLEDDDIVAENFESLAALAALVASKA